ncbi:MAG: hypothetical protein FWH41_04385 [Treponema sp.]|nr:hypothetical protein [Treponema sp.]
MNCNTALRFVISRANTEREVLGHTELMPEHFFLALLKLSELSAEEISPFSAHKQQTNVDIMQIRQVLRKEKIDSGNLRQKLTEELKSVSEENRLNCEEKVKKIFEKAEKRIIRDDLPALTAFVLFLVFFEDLPDSVKKILSDKPGHDQKKE